MIWENYYVQRTERDCDHALFLGIHPVGKGKVVTCT